MADADYDFGGGYTPEGQTQRHGVNDARATAKLQRTINLAGALASLALVVGLGIWGYKLAVRDVNGVPVIQAMDGPMRISPVDPGGEIADHQGLAVNDVAEAGIATPPPEMLVLAPRPMELAPEDTSGLDVSMLPGLSEASAPTDLLTANADLALAAAPVVESADPTEVAVDAALAEALGEAPEDVPVEPGVALVPNPTLEPAPEGAILASIRPRARPGARAETPAPAEMTALPAPNEVDPATLTPGTRLVQFGTFDTADEARAAWTALQGRFGELMTEKAMVVQPAESGGRTFYRLRAHGFEGEDDARRFCSAFVAQDATCIPVPHK
jgi:SPOR domain